jgi:ABC-type transport system involved in multi-copper enzyme maturation permease subunit
MFRAFRSELIKFSRWSVLAGGAAMIAATAGWSYFAVNRATTGASMSRQLVQALPTPQGLITLVGAAAPFITAIAIITVAANVAAEWSQGTLRNLLVREPGRLRLLAGKVLALLFFVTVSAALALLAGGGITLLAAQANGISTAPWTSSDGVNTFFSFFGNELLDLVGVSLLGICIAVLTRSTAPAVGISLAYVLVVEGLIGSLWPDGAEWLPVHIFGYLPGTASPMSYGVPPMGYDTDLIVALLWMAGFVVVSAVLFRFRDVSA